MQYAPREHARHAVNDELPVKGLYVPAGQEAQAELPVDGLYVPAAQ